MVERANRKLGLERAMNADRGNDGLKDGARGPTQDRAEIDAMLKRGAHDIFINDADDDSQFQKFNSQVFPCSLCAPCFPVLHASRSMLLSMLYAALCAPTLYAR